MPNNVMILEFNEIFLPSSHHSDLVLLLIKVTCDSSPTAHAWAFPIVSNGTCQDKPQMKTVVKFHLDCFFFDCMEVFSWIAVLTVLSTTKLGVNDLLLCSFPSMKAL